MSLLEMIAAYFAKPMYFALTLGALFLAVLVLSYSRNKNLSIGWKVFLIYAHIALLIVPIAIFAYSSGCAVPLYSCTGKALLYASPLILAAVITGAGILGYFFLPILYNRRFKSIQLKDKKMLAFVHAMATKYRIKKPQVHILDEAVPKAYSFSSNRPAIFITMGMLDLLSRKEIEAVMLHEIGHLANKSSFVKFSSKLLKLVSPVAMFSPPVKTAIHTEETAADCFAVNEQGTNIHLESARRKTQEFFDFSG